MGLHYVLQHLDRPGTYVRILFVDFSSAFNTIIPNLLLPKLTQLSVPTSVCQLINSFLTYRQQLVRLGKFSSSTRSISTGAPQGCVLSPLLFSLYTNDCTSKDPSVKLLKFADDTTLIGLIQDGDDSAYRQEVKELAVWCSINNLELNTLKTVEMIVDFRRTPFLPSGEIPRMCKHTCNKADSDCDSAPLRGAARGRDVHLITQASLSFSLCYCRDRSSSRLVFFQCLYIYWVTYIYWAFLVTVI